MIKKYFLFLLLTGFAVYGQGEANNWYFGNGAGLHFEANGNVTSLPNGQIYTTEGCSSISDANGNLLFYTDGRTVWDRNHVKMPNGDYFNNRGLYGDPSSTQSGIIIPKPNDPNIYYIFTVDEPHHENAATYPNRNTAAILAEDDGYNNGFNYSVVDLTLTGNNGSIGNITNRNRHLVTYDPNPDGEEIKYKCSEKITAVRDGSGGYWVITQFVNRFYAFRITSAGVAQTPVVSTVEPYITTGGYRRNAIGYLKASPNGQKLALAHSQNGTITGETTTNGSVYLYDFDRNTGIVSNPLLLKDMINPYGIEFSAETKKLYASVRQNNQNSIIQFDLEDSDIPASGTVIGTTDGTGALQLGPNKKIYFANGGAITLGVINSPEESGYQCNYVPNGVVLAYGSSSLGLPPFITSVFYPSFQAEHTCFGDTTTFTLPPSFLTPGTTHTIAWDFGDSTAISNMAEPTHVFGAPGNYQVSVTITVNGESFTSTKEVTIHEVPAAYPANKLELCDTDHDGIMAIDLQQQNNAILNGQNPTTFEVRYFTTPEDATNNTNAVNASAFSNTTAAFTIYARVQNRNNATCYALTDFAVTVTPKPLIAHTDDYALCDDTIASGIKTFNLASRVGAILGNQNPADFTVTFHFNQAQADTGANPLPDSYTNVIPGDQEIFIRVENKLNPDCFATAGLHLKVNPLPIATPATLVQCDFGVAPDGLTTFNLAEAISSLTNGNTNTHLTTTFFSSVTDAASNTNPLNPVFTNTTNPQQLGVRITDTTTGCYVTTTLDLQVTLAPTQRYELNVCSATAYGTFTLTDTGLEAPGLDVHYYATLIDALTEQNELNTTFTNTVATSQLIYARIESNNDCNGLHEIRLTVRPLPAVGANYEPVLCAGTIITLSAGIADTTRYDFLWSNGATQPILTVNTAGVYTVKVTDKRYGCEATRTITVTGSDIAVITTVEVDDLSDNNTVTVYAGGISDHYIYALDSEEGPYQDSNFFDHVSSGIHTVYVKDYNGCGIAKKLIAVLGIPKFFTPNGDGYNDLWRIKGAGISPYKDCLVDIFDRYGKLVYQMKASGGWNGIYNRQPLPSTDYWYVLHLPDGRDVKGHFSLKR